MTYEKIVRDNGFLPKSQVKNFQKPDELLRGGCVPKSKKNLYLRYRFFDEIRQNPPILCRNQARFAATNLRSHCDRAHCGHELAGAFALVR